MEITISYYYNIYSYPIKITHSMCTIVQSIQGFISNNCFKQKFQTIKIRISFTLRISFTFS